ncbi:MAG: DNA replication/repair protein RecF [Bacteroidota bacterium]
MVVTELRLKNFRNHVMTRLEFGEGVNALVGGNGQGKTNVLEALSYLSLTKSFFAANDATVIQIGKESFEVDGTIQDTTGSNHEVMVSYSRTSREKVVRVDRSKPETLASVVGKFPVVILSPDHGSISAGGPSERRKFMDILLSQTSRSYLEDLLEYRRALRQKNRLLMRAKMEGVRPGASLEPWSISLARHGGRIMRRRRDFAKEFQPFVRRAYTALAEEKEQPEVTYVPTVAVSPDAPSGEIERVLAQRMEASRREEERRGLSLTGPHRDELKLCIDSRRVQEYASQGQHKTLLVALKVAEFWFMKERITETPALLLDDVFGELDPQRSRRMLSLVPEMGQTVVTTTDERFFENAVQWNGRNKRYFVEKGVCRNG